jgi:phage gp29-like protein
MHYPRLKSGLPLRNGLARLVAVMYMLKSFTVRDWWAFAEKFGIPIVVGKYGNNASDEQIKTSSMRDRSIASDAGCAIPQSMQLDMQETASRNGGGALFKEMAEWCDAQTSKAVLGQTMTTDDGSSRSQADVHDRVRMDIARWDARQLENTLNEFLVRPFIQFNYGPQEKYPRVKLAISEPEDLKAFVDALIPLVDRGLRVQESEVRDKFGLAEPENGAAVLTVQQLSAFSPAPALNREQLALNRSQDDEIDVMVSEALKDWEQTGDAFTSPVLQLAKDVGSFEEFLARLPDLQKTLEPAAFVEQLAMLSFKARTLGDANDG